MPDPFVGLPDDNPGDCGYAGADLTGQRCPDQPVAHLRMTSPGWGEVALATCARHESIALACGELIDRHDWRQQCADPGERWPDITDGAS